MDNRLFHCVIRKNRIRLDHTQYVSSTGLQVCDNKDRSADGYQQSVEWAFYLGRRCMSDVGDWKDPLY